MLAKIAAGPFGALLTILVVLAAVWHGQRLLPLNGFDQPFYLGIAQDLRQTGNFTNGFMFDPVPAGVTRAPGMRFAPLYPATLALLADIDPGLRVGMACVVATDGRDPSCPDSAPVARGVQFGELAGFFMMVWAMGRMICGSRRMAWLTLALGLVASPLLLRSVGTLMTEMSCLVLVTGAVTCALAASRVVGVRSVGWALLGGVLLGLSALTRPGFQYLIPFAACLGSLAAWRRGRGQAPVAAFVAGSVVAVSPWVCRNVVQFGRASLTFGYDSHTLVQRIAFDTMDWREYGLAYLCWLPDGTSLGRQLIGPGACDRFGWDNYPNSFYSLGLRHMLDQTLQAAGGYQHHMSYLLHHYIFRMPVWHMLVSVPLALRGAYVAHWWGFVLLAPCLIWSWIAVRRGAGGFLFVALPAWLMLGLNASVAVNQVRYNLMLVPAYALAGALSLRWVGSTRLVSGWVRRILGRGGPRPSRD